MGLGLRFFNRSGRKVILIGAFMSYLPAQEDPALWLQLIRSRRIGPVTFHRLLAEHGGVEAAVAALPEIAKAAGIEGYEICPIWCGAP